MSYYLAPPPPYPIKTREGLVEWLAVTVKSKKGEIRNPPNDFLLFRKWFNKFSLPRLLWDCGVRKAPTQEVLSQLLQAMWNELPDDEKAYWKEMQREVRAFHVNRYPSFHSAESKMKRKEEKREERMRKARESANAESGVPGPSRKRSPKGRARSTPYPPQRAQSLPSSTVPASNLPPTHASTFLPGVPVPTTAVDTYMAPTSAYRPIAQPAMYGPSSSSFTTTPSSYTAPLSSHPPSATLPFSSPLPPSSFFAPPPAGSVPHHWHHGPSRSPAPLPFPITSSIPTIAIPSSPVLFPPQQQYQIPHGGYPSMTSPPNPPELQNNVDYLLNLFGLLEPDATLDMDPLPENNLFSAQQPEFENPTTFFDLNGWDTLLQLPN